MPRGQAPGRVRSDTGGAGASCGETAGPRRTVCRLAVTGEGAVVAEGTLASTATLWLVLLGVLALRAVVILSPQL
jgi:hypothetical protein